MHTTTHSGDFGTAFSLFTAWRPPPSGPEQQMALIEGFDNFSGHDAGQVIALFGHRNASPAEAQEALTRLTDRLQRLCHEATQLDLALRYTRALDTIQLLNTVGEQ